MTDELAVTRATYDVIAATFAVRTAHGHADLADDVAAMRDWVGAGAWVADVGCGPGRDSVALAGSGLRVVSMDLSVGMLRAGVVARPVQCDMRSLPLRAGSVSGVWCQAALLHIPRRYAPGVLAGFARVLAPGGRLHLAVAEGDGEGWEVASTYESQRQRWLAEAGFVVDGTRRQEHGRVWLTVAAHTPKR
jgi:ubiquinone/menaquinone biosynthesis C-methylase UbiE